MGLLGGPEASSQRSGGAGLGLRGSSWCVTASGWLEWSKTEHVRDQITAPAALSTVLMLYKS